MRLPRFSRHRAIAAGAAAVALGLGISLLLTLGGDAESPPSDALIAQAAGDTDLHFLAALGPGNGGWQAQATSGNTLAWLPDRVSVEADSGGYSRIRHSGADVEAGETLVLSAVLELPADFYARQTNYVRLLGTDNYDLASQYDGTRTWRLGVGFRSGDHVLRLWRQRQGVEETNLVSVNRQLPTGGQITLTVRARISSGPDALSELYVDGELWGSSSAPTLSPGMPAQAQRVTRVYAGLDGASNYSGGKRIALDVLAIDATEDEALPPAPPPPPPPPPTTTAPPAICDQACVDAYEAQTDALETEVASLEEALAGAQATAATLRAALDAWQAWYATAPAG